MVVLHGVLRGAGAMRQFMASTFTDLALRVLLAFALSWRFGAVGIWLSWPAGWSVAAALSVLFYRRLQKAWENDRKGENTP